MRKKPEAGKSGKRQASFQGRIIKALIADLASSKVGHGLQTGEFRRHLTEPPYRCPEGYEIEFIENEEFSMEYFSPAEHRRKKVVLQLHGGGYHCGMKNSYRKSSIVYSKCGRGCDVLTVDYRLAPEHPFPAALMDAFRAYQWLMEERGFSPEDIVFAGDSAGGGLCLGLCHYLKDHGFPLPRGVVAMSPWTDLLLTGPSYKDNFDKDPLFGGTTDSLLYYNFYVKTDEEKRNPYVSPLYGDFTGFPPILFQVGDSEMLFSDTMLSAAKAKKAGVKVKTSIYPGMFHVFQMGFGLMPESKKAWEEVSKFLTKMWK